MRLRNIPGADEVISNSAFCIQNPIELKGKWHEFFGNTNPIHIEVGMGKGRFLMDLARQNPQINYIGIERYTSVLLRAVQKIDFKNGCQGASGNEQEETLLLTPTVVNKSIPVILCDEEDVAGEHGATIGKLSNDILFYMNAHGISKEAAEKIMCLAKINNVAAAVPDENLKEKISQYVEEAFYE